MVTQGKYSQAMSENFYLKKCEFHLHWSSSPNKCHFPISSWSCKWCQQLLLWLTYPTSDIPTAIFNSLSSNSKLLSHCSKFCNGSNTGMPFPSLSLSLCLSKSSEFSVFEHHCTFQQFSTFHLVSEKSCCGTPESILIVRIIEELNWNKWVFLS